MKSTAAAVALSITEQPPKRKRRKKLGPSALQRSMDILRQEGYTVDKAEHWNAFARIRKDLFGFIDVMAVGHCEIVAVQVTKGMLPGHIEKLCKLKTAVKWLEVGGKIVIHHWREIGPKGKKYWDLEVIKVDP